NFQPFHRPVLPNQQQSGQTNIAVRKFIHLQIESNKEQRYQKPFILILAKLPIDFDNNLRHVRIRLCTALNQAKHMSLPNSRGQAFTGDIAQSQSEDEVEFHHFEEVSRKMTHKENFAGDLELAAGELAWGAEPALHLSGF